ncbi:MAG: hypothetical protein AB2L11_13795 [Syntrophobacteraceae bacterium]
MRNPKCPKYWYAFVLFVILSAVVCSMSSDVYAGGVHFGFGVDVPLPGYAVSPPVMVYEPPVVVERTPPPVVIRRTPPTFVYEAPVVIERRSTAYYYPPSYEYRSHREETERECYRQRSRSWEDDDTY